MIKIGHGFDIHRYTPDGAGIVLAGLKVPFEMGVDAHSDGDVVYHALIDALLGAFALGDIGNWFPDDDQAHKDKPSIEMLLPVLDAVYEKGYTIGNVDVTVIAQKPKLKDYIGQMRSHLAEVLSLPLDCVSIKAKTHEKVDAIGQVKAIAAHAVVLCHDS